MTTKRQVIGAKRLQEMVNRAYETSIHDGKPAPQVTRHDNMPRYHVELFRGPGFLVIVKSFGTHVQMYVSVLSNRLPWQPITVEMAEALSYALDQAAKIVRMAPPQENDGG